MTSPLAELSIVQLTQFIREFREISNLISRGADSRLITNSVADLRRLVEDSAGLPHRPRVDDEMFLGYEALIWPSLDDPDAGLRLALHSYNFAQQPGLAADIPGQSRAELIEAVAGYAFPGGLTDVTLAIASKVDGLSQPADPSSGDVRDLLVSLATFETWRQLEAFHGAHAMAFDHARTAAQLVDVHTHPASYGYDAEGRYSTSRFQRVLEEVSSGRLLGDKDRALRSGRREIGLRTFAGRIQTAKTGRLLVDGWRSASIEMVKARREIDELATKAVGLVVALGAGLNQFGDDTVAFAVKTWKGLTARKAAPDRAEQKTARGTSKVGIAAVVAVEATALGVVGVAAVGGLDNAQPESPTDGMRPAQSGPQVPGVDNDRPSRPTRDVADCRTNEDWIQGLVMERVTPENAARLVTALQTGGSYATLVELVESGTMSPVSVPNGSVSRDFFNALAVESLREAVDTGDLVQARRGAWALMWAGPDSTANEVAALRNVVEANSPITEWAPLARTVVRALDRAGLCATSSRATPQRGEITPN